MMISEIHDDRSFVDTVSLGDKRLDSRFRFIQSQAWLAPSVSFPKMFSTESDLEATYRFLGNDSFSYKEQIEPFLQSTAQKCSELQEVLILHDTTTFSFAGKAHIEGCGEIQTGIQGFFGHASLAVREGEARISEGLIGFRCIQREKGKKKYKAARWMDAVRSSEARLPGTHCIHVADSECDSYPFFAEHDKDGTTFVTRLHHNRETGAGRIFDGVLEQRPTEIEREVILSPRGKNRNRPKKRNPPRQKRNAVLAIKAMPITFKRPPTEVSKSYPKTLELNVVHVLETTAPEGEQPIEWLLVTNLPINDIKGIERIVDIYRSRWLIEEFFKALKTGCGLNKRQLESYTTWTNALGIFLELAWEILNLRNLERAADDEPADKYLRKSFLTVLREFAPDGLPEDPTINQAMRQVARCGGFIKANKKPGWITLAKGMYDLLIAEKTWIKAYEHYSRNVINV